MTNEIRFYNPNTNEDLDKQYMYTVLQDGVVGKLSEDDEIVKIVEFMSEDDVAWEVVGNRYPERLVPSTDKDKMGFDKYDEELVVTCPECSRDVKFDTLPYYRLLNMPFEKEVMCEHCKNMISIETIKDELAERFIERFDYTNWIFEVWVMDKGKEATAQYNPGQVEGLLVVNKGMHDVREAKKLCIEICNIIQTFDKHQTCCIMARKQEFQDGKVLRGYFNRNMLIPYFVVEDLWVPEEGEYDEQD